MTVRDVVMQLVVMAGNRGWRVVGHSVARTGSEYVDLLRGRRCVRVRVANHRSRRFPGITIRTQRPARLERVLASLEAGG